MLVSGGGVDVVVEDKAGLGVGLTGRVGCGFCFCIGYSSFSQEKVLSQL